MKRVYGFKVSGVILPDGNQTLIKTSTGIWAVTYNAENRPVRWEQDDTVVTMDFDRMGHRVEC